MVMKKRIENNKKHIYKKRKLSQKRKLQSQHSNHGNIWHAFYAEMYIKEKKKSIDE